MGSTWLVVGVVNIASGAIMIQRCAPTGVAIGPQFNSQGLGKLARSKSTETIS